VGEEITWRGVQTALLAILTGNLWIAAILSAASFGLSHIIQGWRSVAVVVVFALCFQTLVWLAGSLYVAMAVHIAYDITAGITYGRLGRQLAPEGLDVG
jgi:membrane protease YdiL (CAAX protease family)